MKRTLVLGDPHGRARELKEVLELSDFDRDNDTLIVVGDVCDGGRETKECVDVLLTIPNLIFVYGNHDIWMRDYANGGDHPWIWISQGGASTLRSYGGLPDDEDLMCANWIDVDIPESHLKFWNSGIYYHEQDDMLFVHGGFNPAADIVNQKPDDIMWDRFMAMNVKSLRGDKFDKYAPVNKYKKIFIGHTFIGEIPITSSRITALDTGAGHMGRLTLMDVETMEYWQSGQAGPAE